MYTYIMIFFFCSCDSAADRDPAKMVPQIVRDVVGASNQSLWHILIRIHLYTFTSDRITFYLHLNFDSIVYIPICVFGTRHTVKLDQLINFDTCLPRSINPPAWLHVSLFNVPFIIS